MQDLLGNSESDSKPDQPESGNTSDSWLSIRPEQI